MLRFKCLLGAILLCASATAGEITPRLARAMDSSAPDERLRVVVLMEAFPEQEQLLGKVRTMNRCDRRSYVIASQKGLTARTQTALRSKVLLLDPEPETPRPVRTLWGINGLALAATADEIEQLARVRSRQVG